MNNYLLMSVNPECMEMYKRGSKIAELRKTEPKREFDTVLFYNTGNHRIELKAEIVEVRKTNLSEIEQRFHKYVGIQPKKIKHFLNKRKEGFLLIFSYISIIRTPVTYEQMTDAGIMPPQNYVYVSPETFNI